MEKVKIDKVDRTQETSKAGKPYTKYAVNYNGGLMVNTLDKTFGEYLVTSSGQEVEWELGKNKFGYNEITSIMGIQKEQKGGGGYKKNDPETQAHIDKAIKEKNENILVSVAQNNCPSHMEKFMGFPGVLDAMEKGDEKRLDIYMTTYLRYAGKLSSGLLASMRADIEGGKEKK